jgi:hypothetical protein
LEIWLFIIFLFFCYAETHYRFRFFVSYLKKNEPEIIADVPFRIEPNEKIPVLILLKDAHRYPVTLQKIIIEIIPKHEKNGSAVTSTYDLNQKIEDYLWYKFYEINPPEHFSGELSVDVTIHYTMENKEKRCRNDNYRTSSHKPFTVYVAKTQLPKRGDWIYGDIHYHSSYTDDHVEFGAPLTATKIMAKAMGLKWFAATDHSYDLDDQPQNYLKNDPNLRKWHRFIEEVNRINSENDEFAIIPGEEVSAGNNLNQNVHLLALGIRNFIPGMGDSAEEWLVTKPTLSVTRALGAIQRDGGIAVAAHPFENVPFLQKKLLRRGKWKETDFAPNCKGLQIWNGTEKEGFRKGLKQWKKLLLNGEKKFIVGGNDAHGNFNRFRQIKTPFFKIGESDKQVFAKVRTAVLCHDKITEKNLLNALSHGRAIVTNGPFITIEVTNKIGETAQIGGTIVAREITVNISAISSSEFGNIHNVKIFRGTIGSQNEDVLYRYNDIEFINFSYTVSTKVESYFYLRAEVVTEDGKLGFTNPIWVKEAVLE